MREYRYPRALGGSFEFAVGFTDVYKYNPRDEEVRVAFYTVQLPHHCDSWEITSDPDKAKAITEMERFIAEAQVALQTLRELE